MSSASNIEWTDTTWNPVVGCAKVSAGCKHCYAETMAARHVLMSAAQGRESPYLPVVDVERRRWNGRAATVPGRLADPLSWRKPRRVFVNSMSDLFHEDVPLEFIAAVFGVMAATPQHTYQVLTKRPARILEFFDYLMDREVAASAADVCLCDAEEALNEIGRDTVFVVPNDIIPWPLPNVWLGVSVEDQRAADERIPLLLSAPAAVRFISAEPLLGEIELSALVGIPKGAEGEGADYYNALRGFGFFSDGEPAASYGERLDWVIAGGESGPGARTCDLAWIRSIVAQCARAQVACFVKQLGARPLGAPPCIGCEGERFEGDRCERCGDVVEVEAGRRVMHLEDRKGGDPSEWPEDLRVRQWPEVRRG